MLLKDISFETPEKNILFDEVLLDLAEKSEAGEVLRFWESPKYFIVLGRTSNPEDDIKHENVLKEGIPVLRRASGGGTVVQGQGCLNFSLILSKEINPEVALLRKSYQFILGKVVAALVSLGVPAAFKPVSDLALEGSEKKFSGNAQKRGKQFILHHGTLLYGFDLSQMERYLKMPKNIPEYRRERTHEDFVTNIAATTKQLKFVLCNAFGVEKECSRLDDLEQSRLEQYAHSKTVQVT